MTKSVKFVGILVLTVLLTFCQNEPIRDTVTADFKILIDTAIVVSVEKDIPIQFENLSTNAVEYLWDFGTSDISTDENPTYTYDSIGLFEVTLIAYGSDNNLDSCSKTIQVIAAPDTVLDNSYWLNEEQIEAVLLACYASLRNFTVNQFLIDASYCNFKNIDGYGELYSHIQSANNSKIESLWESAYSTLSMVSIVLEKVADGTISDEIYDTEALSAQLRVIRACIYQNLTTWFGDVPLIVEGMEFDEIYSISRAPARDILDYLVQDLRSAIEVLPVTWPFEETWQAGESFKIDKNFARGLLAEIYLIQEDLNSAQELTDDILNSEEYALSQDTSGFSIQSPEIIFACYIQDPGGASPVFLNTYDFEYIPVMRTTNILLLSCEIEFKLGNIELVVSRLNQLRERRRQASLEVGISKEEIESHLFNQYILELSLEGKSFFAMKRFEKATEWLGIEHYKLLLPLPYEEIIINPNISQNEGY